MKNNIKDTEEKQEKVFYEYKIRVELANQISMYESNITLNERDAKNLIVKKIFTWIKNSETYFDFQKSSTQLSIIKLQELNESILIFKLAKKKDIKLTSREETFVGRTEFDYPYSLVIFDYIGQVFYVEKNYKVFQSPIRMVGILQTLLSSINETFSRDGREKFFVNMISDASEFNECFDTFDLVSKVSLKLDSPNSFLGSRKADDFLNELRGETNAKKTTMEISNKEGLHRNGITSIFGEFFKYISNGGGLWSISGKPKGKEKSVTKTSNTKIKTLNLTVNISADQNIINNSEKIINVIESQNRFDDDE